MDGGCVYLLVHERCGNVAHVVIISSTGSSMSLASVDCGYRYIIYLVLVPLLGRRVVMDFFQSLI